MTLARRAVELSPRTGLYRNTLGVAFYRAGAFERAVDVLKKSMKLREGGDALDWFLLAMAHWKLARSD